MLFESDGFGADVPVNVAVGIPKENSPLANAGDLYGQSAPSPGNKGHSTTPVGQGRCQGTHLLCRCQVWERHNVGMID